jgi:hypothetical protein
MKNHELHRARFNEDLPVSISKHAIQSKGEDEINVILRHEAAAVPIM